MGYKIRYGPVNQERKTHRRLRLTLLTIAFFCLFVFVSLQCFSEELTALVQLWLPYGQAEDLVSKLRQGEQLTDAVATFWQDMLYGQ